MEVVCEVCGRDVPQKKRGITLYHPACKVLHDDLKRIRKHLDLIKAGTHPANLEPQSLVELRYELFCLVSEIPRPRIAKGRPGAGQYLTSRLSPAYDDAVKAKKAKAAAAAEGEE
jgi:hypothetical protein